LSGRSRRVAKCEVATTMSTAAAVNAGNASAKSLDSPPKKDLSGLIPYLRRYTGAIVFGLVVVGLMGIIGNVLPLAIGIMTDTLAGSPAPFQHVSATDGAPIAALPHLSTLTRSIPYYAPHSRRPLGIYCLFVIFCV